MSENELQSSNQGEEQEDPVEAFMSLDNWPSSSEILMVGFVIVNVVGIRHYDGIIRGREMVGLVRDELNPYDPNAIKVLNTRSKQVGYIERSAASVLSPLLDDRAIIIEGIVPRVSGRDNIFKVPCQIHIFSRLEEFERVKVAIARGGLQLISESSASFTLSEAVVIKVTRGVVEERSVDEIFKMLDLKVCNEGAAKPLDPPKNMIKSELFSHQKEGLGWLVSRENSCDLPPFWEAKDGVYVNDLTNYQSVIKPEPMRGGIFADDMGLGKTLTLLSLIAYDKWAYTGHSCSNVDAENDEEPGKENFFPLFRKVSKRGRSSIKAETSKKKQKTEDFNNKPSGSMESRTTLIVCPPSVFSAWITQLEEHTKVGCFKVYIYYGERTNDPEELQKYDIVLTTYSTLAIEQSSQESPINKIEWRRIILDEAHVIKNVNSQQSRAVINLKAKRRWAVTGTPIENSSLDLFSLMAFLKFEPFSVKSLWNSLIQRPLAQGDEKGISRLQVLMATLSLRRTKEKGLVGLPSKTIETCFVNLREEEREIYDQMEGEAQRIVKRYISAESLVVNYSTVLSILVRLRQICTHLALCPSDIKALLPPCKIEDVKNNPTLLEKLLSVLQDGEDFDCPICISPPTDVVITSCAHIFCRSCILKTIKKTKPCCPMCRHPLSESDLFRSPPQPSQTSSSSGASSNSSSKVAALLKLLSESREASPATKSIIFSQFRKMLFLLEEPLKEAGFKTIRLDGSLNAKKRAEVISEFGDLASNGPTILLASLRASSAGINLTAASRVYLMEPWWNPAVEEQAMDRVHRIGQTEDVKIVRLIAINTIEERILQLQENKKLLARKAFGKRGSKDQREINMDDLHRLMNL
ncbi:hypothetical protein RD792_012681 [Penstemon davidsonii]|uniref:SWI/SNF-related matrix-associated actin-dependent regulator of chromatin subfamily A member 3-like 1 n=1 Tax=Penstemon davidsonii TaxID=160366 RepID=A0ABR0CXM2_9LAMI|nr:hypothetical protein RD792_012681 [Penstemon davidsonii]